MGINKLDKHAACVIVIVFCHTHLLLILNRYTFGLTNTGLWRSCRFLLNFNTESIRCQQLSVVSLWVSFSLILSIIIFTTLSLKFFDTTRWWPISIIADDDFFLWLACAFNFLPHLCCLSTNKFTLRLHRVRIDTDILLLLFLLWQGLLLSLYSSIITIGRLSVVNSLDVRHWATYFIRQVTHIAHDAMGRLQLIQHRRR